MPSNFEFLVILLILVFGVWDFIWKLIAMWKAAKRSQTGWFISLAILSTAGILPIIYLLVNKDKTEV